LAENRNSGGGAEEAGSGRRADAEPALPDGRRVLEARNLKFRAGRRLVLDGVELSVAAGEFLGIRGPTGCGKTTLLRVIAGLAQPEDGVVSFAGRTWDSPGTHVSPHRRKVGMAFQHLGLWPHMNAVEHIGYVLEGRREAGGREAACAWLARFGMEALASRKPDEMSGGQKHLLALARALAGNPNVVLLDEALAGLDDDLKEKACRTILEIQEETGFCGIMVSHDRSEIARLCRRCARMSEGRLLEQP
jgi:ABC-type Fe3+/spermidine/putrescine transport system ATPase subunit